MERVGYRAYTDQLEEEFSDINPKDLRRAVRHGLALLVLFRKNYHDIYLSSPINQLYYYFGDVQNDEAKRKDICKKKLAKKIRLVHSLKVKGQPRDPYYYFSLSEDNYQLHLQNLPIARVVLFRVEKELDSYKFGPHKFRVLLDARSWRITHYNYETKDTEHVH